MNDWRGYLIKFFDDGNCIRNIDFFFWLDIFFVLIFRGLDIDVVEINGWIVLYIGINDGLVDVVNVFF